MGRRRMRGSGAQRSDDAGMTLVELLVAMGIFVVVIAVFMSGIVSMTKTTTRSQAVSDATSSARKVLDRLDKQVRYATEINTPGESSTGKFYVEYRMAAQAADAAQVCVQWRYDPTAGTLATRTWTDVTGTPSAWNQIADHVRNKLHPAAPASPNPPFVFTLASLSSLHQQLTVNLDIGQGSLPGATVSTNYVARNTSTNTVTNPDINSDGVPDTQICTTGARQ